MEGESMFVCSTRGKVHREDRTGTIWKWEVERWRYVTNESVSTTALEVNTY